MKKTVVITVIVAVLAVAVAFSLVGCGGSQGIANAPSEAEVGAPVYPGARYTGTGLVKGTYKYSSEDSSTKIVGWYREKLKRENGFRETNEFEEAITGNAMNYTDGDKSVWITVLPGKEGLPTTIDISVNQIY